jgi:hypothetical protein
MLLAMQNLDPQDQKIPTKEIKNCPWGLKDRKRKNCEEKVARKVKKVVVKVAKKPKNAKKNQVKAKVQQKFL